MMENTKDRLFTISAYTENSPGVLQRISTSFTKRKINIETLTVSETSQPGLSLFTITAYIDPKIVPTIVKQIERIIEVRKAFACDDENLIFVEVALIRVARKETDDLEKVEKIAKEHDAQVVYSDQDSIVVETYGKESETKAIYKELKNFEVLQFVRSGRIALRKKYQSIYTQ